MLLTGPGQQCQAVSRAGNSASLTLAGLTQLDGVFATGALQVGTVPAQAGLAVAPGSTIAASTAATANGAVQAPSPAPAAPP